MNPPSSTSLREAPAPNLSWSERAYRARRIGLTFGRIYLGIKANQVLERRLRPRDMEERWREFHRRSARQIYDAAIELRGLILKGCQFLGARADVLPPEYVRVLGRLQDRVPAHGFDVVRSLVEWELDVPIEDVFREFSEAPIASASLAQVHEARLHDGTRVAVKVQYPDIADSLGFDLANLRALFRAVGVFERDFDLWPLIEEFGAQVPKELDFEHEARNAEAMAKRLEHRDDVRIPRIHWDLSTPRVLVMEFMEGIKIDDRDALVRAGVEPEWAVRTLADCFAEQMLRHGHFHADPHPGNLWVDPEGPRLILLDFGLTKQLPDGFREGVLGFGAALIQGDANAMGRALVDLGFETRDGEPEGLAEIADVMLRFAQEARARASLDPDTVAALRDEIPERVRQNPIVRIPHHLVLVGRTLGLLSGVSRSLDTRLDLLPVVAPYVFGNRPPGGV